MIELKCDVRTGEANAETQAVAAPIVSKCVLEGDGLGLLQRILIGAGGFLADLDESIVLALRDDCEPISGKLNDEVFTMFT